MGVGRGGVNLPCLVCWKEQWQLAMGDSAGSKDILNAEAAHYPKQPCINVATLHLGPERCSEVIITRVTSTHNHAAAALSWNCPHAHYTCTKQGCGQGRLLIKWSAAVTCLSFSCLARSLCSSYETCSVILTICTPSATQSTQHTSHSLSECGTET